MTQRREVRRATAPALMAAGVAALLGSIAAVSALAQADAWPTRPVFVIIPFGSGTATDVVARVVMDQVSHQIGQPVVLEDRPGAGSTTGVAYVAKAAPDGYTLLAHSSTFSAAEAIYKTLPYDTLADFTAIVPLAVQPTVLVVSPSKGWKSAAELIAAAKAKPGQITFASAGIGSTSHLAAERLRVAAGFTALHVPYKSPSEGLTDVVAGRVDFYFLPLSAGLPLIQAGKLVPLAVSSATRAASLPNVPTITEIGLKEAAYDFWLGLFAPAKTPTAIVDRIYKETRTALDMPDIQQRLTNAGAYPMPMTRAEFTAYFRNDVQETVKLAKEAGIPKTDF
jgi:tripartite-type tricarboxylate transporter receptor subunit TctC